MVDIDRFTGETKVRRFYALDDCGTRINPMIIEGQIHGGLTEAFAVAFGQAIPFDEHGNHLGNSLMDYFLPTAVETPHWETDHTVTPSPHHPIGAKGVAESPHVGGIPCFTNAVVDAFAHLGVTHMDMPHTAYRVWQQCQALRHRQALAAQTADAMKVEIEKSLSDAGVGADARVGAAAGHRGGRRLHAGREDHRAARRPAATRARSRSRSARRRCRFAARSR